MKIPEQIRIGSMVYSVTRTDEFILVDHKECMGDIDYLKKTIRIKRGIQDSQGEQETLLHEIIHGITHERNFGYNNNDEETVTEELARGLHQIILDNPNMFEGE